MAKVHHPIVSVIIPVFNDATRLQLCLGSLAQQTYPRSHYEIIVVDNGSDCFEQVKDVVVAHAGVMLAQEPVPGSYAARNRGITLAQGEVIAFTDADCIPAANWLERGVAQLQALDGPGMVAGRVEVFPAAAHNPTLIETFQMVTGFPQKQHLQQFNGAATANVFTHRRVIEQVGTFNQTLKSFGDFEWGKRVFQAGYAQLYAADVVVRHPARRTWADLRQRTVRAAGGVYDYFVTPHQGWLGRCKTLARLLVDDLTPPINFAITAFRYPGTISWQQRLGMPVVLLGVRYVSALEKLRLWFGGVSKRT